MHTFSRNLWRWLGLLLLLVTLPGITFARPAGAQGPQETVEAAALRAHLQNLRTHSFTFWIGGGLGSPANAPLRSVLGEVLDGWTLAGLNGDPGATLADLTRPTLLNFWASWCPPCRLEFPHLVRVALAPQDHAFDVLFVNMSDTEQDALAFLDNQPNEIHTVLDPSDQLARHSSIESIPTSVLIDTEGNVLAVHVGMMTPTITAFFDSVAANPGMGTFVAADHAGEVPAADLLPVDAESATPLQAGARTLGTISDEDFQQTYRFEGHAGETVRVDMQVDGADLDAYLVLMAPDGTWLAENDDADSLTTNSAIEAALPTDGTYLVVATRFLEAEGYAVGDYSLTLTVSGGAGGQSQQSGEGFITYGSSVQGRVSGINPRELYAFEGRAGDVVTLRATHEPGDITLRIELKDPHLNRLAISEESVNGAAALVDVELPEDGNYLVVVMRPRSRDTENLDYTLTLNAAGATPQPTPAAVSEVTLAYGETVSGMISDDHFEDRWTFAGQSGDTITIHMTRTLDEPGGLDGYLVLIGPDGATLAEADDWQNSVMPGLEGFALPTSGTYTLVATRFGLQNGFSTGEYALSLTRTGSDGTAALPEGAGAGPQWLDPASLPDDLRWIGYNENIAGTLNNDNVDDWVTFRGTADDIVTVRLSAGSGDLDPYLILVDSAGYELASNDDATVGSADAAVVDFALPTTGSYLIRATRYGFGNGPSSGNYGLIIETSAATPRPGEDETPMALVYSEPAGGSLSVDNMADLYTFEGRAGDVITIAVQSTGSAEIEPALSLRGPDSAEVAFSHGWTQPSEARISRFVLPQGGVYTLEVLLANLNQSGDYRLVLLRTAPTAPPSSSVTPTPGLDLELVLSWKGEADLVLTAAAPTGGHPGAGDGPAHDFCADRTAAPLERRAWNAGTAVEGVYEVSVYFRLNCGGTADPVPFTLTVIEHGAVVDVISGELLREGDSYHTLLDYRP